MSDRFTPQMNGNGVTFLLRMDKCTICGQNMVVKPEDNRDTFPGWVENDFDAQAKRGGLVKRSRTKVNGEYICIECEAAGRATFLCELCKERKPTNKIQESFGDPPEYLCADCYKTTPARVWDEKAHSLHDAHRYDFC